MQTVGEEKAEEVHSGSTTQQVVERVEAPPKPPKKSKGRAHTADFVRVVLFAGVVVAHSVNSINTTPDVVRSAQLVGTLGHLTRYGFVAVTLFVLVLSMQGRSMSPVQFWRRRFGLVVWPYLVWTLIYSVTDHVIIEGNPFPSPGRFFTDLAHDAVTGEGKYQLYFLLISMQIYLFFPVLSWIVNRTAHRPWWTLGTAFVIQMAMFVLYQYLPRPAGDTWVTVYDNLWKTLPMYAVFVAIGMLAGIHHEAVSKWLRDHAVAVISMVTVCAAFTIGAYVLATSPGNVPLQSNTPWNPASLPWYVGGLVLLWLIAMAWNSRRESGRAAASKAVTYATFRAFGVFAVHPLILDILARAGFFGLLFDWFPHSAAIRTTVLTATVLAISLVVVDILLRTPLSRWLVARDRIPVTPTTLRKLWNGVRRTSGGRTTRGAGVDEGDPTGEAASRTGTA
ncbi:acyltransferase [Gordonia sp. CPCC 206044]|uniref:acyltransferase n=1 Tax=Gordonia sp. CPCC 206044 TaxID=3140793 RepID=UPI003AF36781